MKISQSRKVILASVAAGFLVGVLIGRSLPWYGSYDECLLRESKGASSNAMQFVRNYCRERFLPAYEAPAAEAPAAEEGAPASGY